MSQQGVLRREEYWLSRRTSKPVKPLLPLGRIEFFADAALSERAEEEEASHSNSQIDTQSYAKCATVSDHAGLNALSGVFFDASSTQNRALMNHAMRNGENPTGL